MAHCNRCGRELPAVTFGTQDGLCRDCRAMTANQPAVPDSSQAGRVVVARRWPPVTTAIVGLNVAVFVAMVLSGISPLNPDTRQVFQWGADYGPLSLTTQPWRILTSNYLHFGIIHIGLNMWCLWNLGLLAEHIFDPWTYAAAYTVCGIAGSLASLWWHPLVVGAGASGAIFGLAGVLIAALYLGRLPIPKKAVQGTLRSLLTFAGYNLFFGVVNTHIDNSAHLGGFVSGLLLGAGLSRHLTDTPEERKRWNWMIFLGAAILLCVVFLLVKRAFGTGQ